MQQEFTNTHGIPNSNSGGPLVPFATGWEHLESELQCLDVRLRREFLKRPARSADEGLAFFKGLVIGDAEAETLLAREEQVSSGNAGDLAALSQLIAKQRKVIGDRRAAAREAQVLLPLARLADLFSLMEFEQACLLVCLAPEIDRKYEKLYAYLQDDATRKRPSLDLILDLLIDTSPEKTADRDAFLSGAPLMTFRLLEWVDGDAQSGAAISRMLKVDERISSYLLGSTQLDSRLNRFGRIISPADTAESTLGAQDFYQASHTFLDSYLQQPPAPGRNLILHLHGPANSDRRLIVQELCRGYGFPMLIADMEVMKAVALPFDQAVWLLAREGALQSAVLVLENMDCLTEDPEKHTLELRALLDAAKTFCRVSFLCGTRSWQPKAPVPPCLFLSQAIAGPDLQTAKRLWEQGLAEYQELSSDISASELAGKFRFGVGQIQSVLNAAENLALWRSPAECRLTASDIYAACRAYSSPRLGALARKIEARYTWDEIVMPEDGLAQLRALCEQARHRELVYGEWGFDRKLSLGKGLNALFVGPPGTGKTMAAEVIARELRLDLYRIDLSQIVSKYIGETEKNLHHIFSEAQAGNAILFFDEADALFGKRSEVKDAHDRFANIEVGYLLQKMEEYEGVAILATNISRNMDEAFSRRMHFIIEFPFPDEQYRKQIWQVAFPKEAPLADEVDFGALAHEIRLSGGNIKNIALAAAFYAAGDGRVIGMPHLWQAARREHQKLGRTWDRNAPSAS